MGREQRAISLLSVKEVHRLCRIVWDQHPDEVFRRDMSHWREHGRWSEWKAWRKLGDDTFQSVDKVLAYLNARETFWNKPRTIIEWGPGGGANIASFSHVTNSYIGVEISEKNLKLSESVAKEAGIKRFVPILLEDSLDVVKEKLPNSADVFLSTAVFQHFPSTEYAKAVLQAIADNVRPRAVGVIQIRYAKSGSGSSTVVTEEDYIRNHIHACTFALEEFWSMCVEVGFEVLFVHRLRPKTRYATFCMRRARFS